MLDSMRWTISPTLQLLAGLVFLLLPACGPKVPALHMLAPLPHEQTCRIAVIPFMNETDYPQAGAIVYRVFMAELVRSGRFDVVRQGDIRDLFHDLRIWPGQQPRIEQMKILGDRLGAKIVITGTVVEMTEVANAGIVNPTLAVSLNIVETDPVHLLWCTYHRREGEQYRKVMHFGVVNTVTSLAQLVSQEVLELWLKEGLRGCAG